VEGKPVVPPGEAKIGDVTECPISGEKFVVTDQSPSLVHEGKTYYFCCPRCKAKAEADPARLQRRKTPT
jgi:YHS domain-containing protein